MSIMRSMMWLSFFVVFTIFTNIGYIYQKLEPDPITYREEEMPTDRSLYYAGESVTFLVSRCIYNSKEVIIRTERHFINVETNQSYPIEGDFSKQVPGCKTTRNRVPAYLPLDMPSGRYYLEVLSSVNKTWGVDENLWRTTEFVYQQYREGNQ